MELMALLFANDIVMLANSEENLQFNITILQEEFEKIYIVIHTEKTKSMVIMNVNRIHSMTLRGKQLNN